LVQRVLLIPVPGASYRRMAAAGSVECGGSLQDLFRDLDSAAEARRRVDVRPDLGPRIMHAEDEFRPVWRPPPAKEDVKRLLEADRTRNFDRFGKKAGTDFEPPCSKRLRPKVLDPWTEDRKDTPARTFAKAYSTIKFQAQSEPFPEPHDGLCHKRTQEWLRQHAMARDKHIHSVYHALQRVQKAEEQLESHEFRRQLARDMLSRSGALVKPNIRANSVIALSKVKAAVAGSRRFHLMAGVDNLQQEEEADKARLEQAKSSPELLLRPPTPKTRAKHLSNWAGPDHPSKCFRESTPWREHDENRALRRLAMSRTQ